MDPRYQRLADVLTGFSTQVEKGENALIEASGIPETFVVALCRAVRERGGHPFVKLSHGRVMREIVKSSTEASLATLADCEMERMKRMQVYIGVRGSENIFESSDIPSEQLAAYMKALRPVLDQRVNHTKWCVLRWPTPSMAQQAMRSTEAFEDFYFRVCTLDYARMEAGMAALKELMEKTDRVHIKGPGTDLGFSIEGIPAVACGGKHNIPDGEVFTAPRLRSADGEVQFNTPTVYEGTSFDNVYLRLEDGKIVDAKANNQARLDAIFDQDEGARFIGEFAIGFNPHITEPMRDILFDEKIAGSFHFTPGQAYEDADNSNRSQVHWDLVQIQRPEYGGGEIYFDDVLIRKDGMFVLDDLKKLNPEFLLG